MTVVREREASGTCFRQSRGLAAVGQEREASGSYSRES